STLPVSDGTTAFRGADRDAREGRAPDEPVSVVFLQTAQPRGTSCAIPFLSEVENVPGCETAMNDPIPTRLQLALYAALVQEAQQLARELERRLGGLREQDARAERGDAVAAPVLSGKGISPCR